MRFYYWTPSACQGASLTRRYKIDGFKRIVIYCELSSYDLSQFQDAGRRVEQPFHPPVRSRPSTLFEQLFVRVSERQIQNCYPSNVNICFICRDLQGIMLRQRTRRRLSQSGDAPAPPPDSILRLSKVHNRIKNSINTSDGSVRKEAAHVRTGMLESAWNAGKNCLSGCMIVLARDVSVSNSHRYILICIVFAQVSREMSWIFESWAEVT